MTINLILNADDYLTYQLYSVSTNKDAVKKRRKSWLTVTGLSFLTAFAFYIGDDVFLFYYALIVGIISLFFYPLYQRVHYKKFYTKHVLRNYEYKFDKQSLVNFQPDYIEIKDVTYEGKLFTSEIEQINEIGTHYFIKFKVGESLVIPKQQVDQTTFLTEILSILQNPNIVIQKQLEWKWR
jgi:hypothetical protein